MYKFKAVTKHGATKLKFLFDIIFNNMIIAPIIISEEGIYIDQKTTQNILLSIFLPCDKFDEYIFNEKEKIVLGIGQNINKEFFKSVKSKDTIILSISKNKSFILDLEKHNVNDNNKQVLSINTEDIQNETFEKFFEYDNIVKISKSNFSDWCKSISNTQIINVVKNEDNINFTFNTGRSTKSLILQYDDIFDKNELINQKYNPEQFLRIHKISSFSNYSLEISIKKDYPLRIKSYNDIGTIYIYIFEDNDDNLNFI